MITISNEYALILLEDRLETALECWGDPADKDLYMQMYETAMNNGIFDHVRDFDPSYIVDNDIVNYCHVIRDDDKDYKKLLKLYHDGCLDVSCEQFEEYGISFIEVVSDDETRILIRH